MKLSIFDKYSQKENNITKSLIDVFRFGEPKLVNDFVDYLGVKEINCSSWQFGLQVGTQLNSLSEIAFVLGIAQDVSDDDFINQQYSDDSIPDAAIISEEVAILIEVKMPGNKLNLKQIEDHKKMFHPEQRSTAEKYRSWEDIYSFFKSKKREYPPNTVTAFLIEQFLLLCQNQGLTSEKSKEFIYANFLNRPKVKNLVMEIDKYIRSMDKVELKEPITDCLGYRKNINGRITEKFFSATLYDKGTFIIHLGRYKKERAKELQEEVNRRFVGNYKKAYASETEVHIQMDRVDEVNQIIPYILEAYTGKN